MTKEQEDLIEKYEIKNLTWGEYQSAKRLIFKTNIEKKGKFSLGSFTEEENFTLFLTLVDAEDMSTFLKHFFDEERIINKKTKMPLIFEVMDDESVNNRSFQENSDLEMRYIEVFLVLCYSGNLKSEQLNETSIEEKQ